ncbi:hypothetical protein ACFPN0_11410 [Kitasatospora cinereorecta]
MAVRLHAVAREAGRTPLAELASRWPANATRPRSHGRFLGEGAAGGPRLGRLARDQEVGVPRAARRHARPPRPTALSSRTGRLIRAAQAAVRSSGRSRACGTSGRPPAFVPEGSRPRAAEAAGRGGRARAGTRPVSRGGRRRAPHEGGGWRAAGGGCDGRRHARARSRRRGEGGGPARSRSGPGLFVN